MFAGIGDTFFFPLSDRWYTSLFTPHHNQVAGEITPKYAILDVATIKHIHSLTPDAKIIFMLRDPIDRIWSQAFIRGRRVIYQDRIASEEVIRSYLQETEPYERSDYLTSLRRWETVFSSEQIFIGFFEQIRDDPHRLLLDIYAFLDVDRAEKYIRPQVRTKVNIGDYPPMPADVAYQLAERCYPTIQQLHAHFNNVYTARWLKSAENHLTRS